VPAEHPEQVILILLDAEEGNTGALPERSGLPLSGSGARDQSEGTE
jgi:hypothetical protein